MVSYAQGGIFMQKTDIDRILSQIAKAHNTTASNVRKEIEDAMRIAQTSPDPAIQARWRAIPHSGPEVTVEELILYIITSTKN